MSESPADTISRANTTETAHYVALTATLESFLSQRPPGADEDVHMVQHIADYAINHFSQPGDTVLDPFAGFGTTLTRAHALGRHALGIELLPERVAHITARTPEAHVIEGDARELSRLLLAAPTAHERCPTTLVLSSPPFMTARDHEADPLTAYVKNSGNYGRYLAELSLVAAQCALAVVPGGYVVWNVADIHHNGRTTHLIDDCTEVLATHLTHVTTIPIAWDQYPHDLTADALLVFQRQ